MTFHVVVQQIWLPCLKWLYPILWVSPCKKRKGSTVVWKRQESWCKYRATCFSVRSCRSLIRLLRTARFLHALRCAHSFAPSLTLLTPKLVGKWEFLCFRIRLFWIIVRWLTSLVYAQHTSRKWFVYQMRSNWLVSELSLEWIESRFPCYMVPFLSNRQIFKTFNSCLTIDGQTNVQTVEPSWLCK